MKRDENKTSANITTTSSNDKEATIDIQSQSPQKPPLTDKQKFEQFKAKGDQHLTNQDFQKAIVHYQKCLAFITGAYEEITKLGAVDKSSNALFVASNVNTPAQETR